MTNFTVLVIIYSIGGLFSVLFLRSYLTSNLKKALIGAIGTLTITFMLGQLAIRLLS
jgi:hypothetical protein